MKIYTVTAMHYCEWSGPDADGNVDVLDEECFDTVILGAYTDRERAIQVCKDYSMNHVVKDPEETNRNEYGPIDCVSVRSLSLDEDPSASASEHVFSV